MSRRRWPFALAAALLVSSLVLAQDAGVLMGASLDDTTTPLTIFGSKLVAWYRPDAGYVSVDGSNNVTQLDDRSGNGYHLNVVGGTPVLVTNSGDPAVDFESTESDALGRAAAPVADEPIAFYAVANMETNLASTRTLASVSTGASSSGWFSLSIGSAENATFSANDGGTAATATHADTLSLATRYVLFGEGSANNARRVNVNGGTEATNSTNRPGAVTPDYISVGARRASGAFTGYHDGLIYEVVVLNAVPTAGQNTSYLAYTTDRFSTP